MSSVTCVVLAGREILVRPSTTPGYRLDAIMPTVAWSSDERFLTRRGAVRLRQAGREEGWMPVHALNHAELYAACETAFGGAL